MQVVIDIGNTRIKWALLKSGGLAAQDSAVHRGELEAAFATVVAALPNNVTRAVVANVAGAALGARLRETLERRGVTVDFVATTAKRCGVRCAYTDPNRLGVDRWLAVLAAYGLARGAACVVSAGTAVTFDAVDAGGQHLGGLILPGARLMAAALDRETSNIGTTPPAQVAPRGLDLLGRDTAQAVGHGTMLALAAAVDRAAARVAAALGTRPPVYLTGGDAPALQPWLETPVDLRADLVLEGLALVAAAPEGSDA
jgi:type III pantothenate kinase